MSTIQVCMKLFNNTLMFGVDYSSDVIILIAGRQLVYGTCYENTKSQLNETGIKEKILKFSNKNKQRKAVKTIVIFIIWIKMSQNFDVYLWCLYIREFSCAGNWT